MVCWYIIITLPTFTYLHKDLVLYKVPSPPMYKYFEKITDKQQTAL